MARDRKHWNHSGECLKDLLRGEEFGEIESWDFFYPRKVLVQNGLLKDLEFPSNKFYHARVKKKE